jgi:hypothetical protein
VGGVGKGEGDCKEHTLSTNLHFLSPSSLRATTAEWLSCPTYTHKVQCSNLGATRHRMILVNH